MSHDVVSSLRSDEDVLDPDAGQGAAVALRPAHALALLLLEDADLRPARLTVDDTDAPGVGDEWRAGEHFAAVLFEHQHAVDADFLAGFDVDAIHGDDRARRHLDLPSAALNDCEHVQLLTGPTDRAIRLPAKLLG